MKKYFVTVTEHDTETGEAREILTDQQDFTGLTILGDVNEDKAVTCIFHDNIPNIASKIAGDSKILLAAKIAIAMKEYSAESAEDDLIDSIMGGIQ